MKNTPPSLTRITVHGGRRGTPTPRLYQARPANERQGLSPQARRAIAILAMIGVVAGVLALARVLA